MLSWLSTPCLEFRRLTRASQHDFLHPRSGRQVEGEADGLADDIDPERALPILPGLVLQPLEHPEAGVVHNSVDSPEAVEHGVAEGIDARRIADVERMSERPRQLGSEPLDRPEIA